MNNIIQISIIRNLLLCIWIFLIAMAPLQNLAYLPLENIEPWGIGKILFIIPELKSLIYTEFFLFFIKILTIILCICSLFFTKQKWLFLITVFSIFIIDIILKSHNGFINHAQMASLYMLIIFAIFPNIKILSINELLRKNQKITSNSIEYSDFLYLLKLVIIIPYSMLGFERIVFGGLFNGFTLFYGDALEKYILKTSYTHAKYTFNFFPDLYEIPTFATLLNIGFLIVTLMELFSIGILFSSLFRKIWVLIIIPFHIITLFSMNIFFWENVLLIIALFTINQRNQLRYDVGFGRFILKKLKIIR